MRRSRELGVLSPVLAAADAGAFVLPPAVVTARAALDRLLVAVNPVGPADPGAAAQSLVDALLDAAQTEAAPDWEWPTPSAVMAARDAEAAGEAWVVAWEFACGEADARLASAITGRADQIIVDGIRPAVADVLVQARKVAPDFAPVASFDDRALLAAKPRHRDAALKLDELASRYSLLREAQRRLTRVEHDREDIYAEVRNLPELYGTSWQGRHSVTWSPFPSSPRQRLVYLVSDGDPAPDVVTLTGRERDARWLAAFGRGRDAALTPGTASLVGPDQTYVPPVDRRRPAGV